MSYTSIKRNWINNGAFNAQAGAVVFNGSVAQTLSGIGTTTFHQLETETSKLLVIVRSLFTIMFPLSVFEELPALIKL